MKMLKYIFLFLFVTAEINSILEENISKRNFVPVAKCINEICKKTLSFRSTVILEHVNTDSFEKRLFLKELINTISTNNIQQVVLENLNKIKDVIAPEEADWMMVVYFSSCELLFKFNFEMIHTNIKYLIIVSDFVETDCKNHFIEIGKYVANYDVTFVFENHRQTVDLTIQKIATFLPKIDEETCKEVVGRFKIINTCKNGTLLSTRIFPTKNPTNLKKCPLNIGIGPLYPFAIIEEMSTLKTFDKLNESQIRGSDLELVKIVGKQFNATLNYHFIKKREENPFGQYDFVQFVRNGSLDICAGGLYRIYGDTVSYSGIYAIQAIIWVYTADRKDKSWSNLVGKIDGLYIFLIYYVFYCCAWCLISKFYHQDVSVNRILISAWGALVGACSLQNARSLKQKILNLMYLIMCLHLSAYVGAQLYSFYTISEPPERLDTINDIMQSGRPTYLISSSKYFVLDEKYIQYANQSRECNTFYDCFEKSIAYKGMTLLLQGMFLNYQAQSAVDDEAIMLGSTEKVLTVFYEMLIRKNSPYVEILRDIIMRLFEAGISEKLYREAIGLTVLGRAKTANENTISNSYRCQTGCKITLEELNGAFYLWLIGCSISFCVFVVECIHKRGGRFIE